MWKNSASDRRSAGMDKSFVRFISHRLSLCKYDMYVYSTDQKYNCTPDNKIPINHKSFFLLRTCDAKVTRLETGATKSEASVHRKNRLHSLHVAIVDQYL